MNKGPEPIVINKWPSGIGESPYTSFAEIRGMDATLHPGAIVLNPKLGNTTSPAANGTFTADAASDTLTGPNMAYGIFGTGYVGARAVILSSTGTLPAGLAPSTIYFLINVAGTTYKLATTLANSLASTAIDITDAGTGVHTITSIDPSYFKAFAYDNVGSKLYAIDSNARVWQQNSQLWFLITGNTLTAGSGNGLTIFKNYIFAFRNNAVDVCSLSTFAWTNSWQTLNGGTGIHRSLVGQDDILYYGDDDGAQNPYVGSIQQAANKVFDPSDSTTFVFNYRALGLPKYKIITALEELGQNLEIGTTGKEIYPWDRTSATFSLPIVCAEKNINALLNINNQLYIAAGNKGNLYYFNGYLALIWKVFPKHLLANDYNTATVGAMATLGRKLLYTVQTVGNSGVYSVDIFNDTRTLIMENPISSGITGTTNPLTLPALYTDGTTYYASWNDTDNSTSGVDASTDSGIFRYPTTTSAYFVTPDIDMGYYNKPRTLQNIEVYLDRPLVTGSSIVIKYRLQVTGSFTTLATFSGDSTNQVFQTPAAVISGTDVQIKVEVNGTSSTTPYLQEIILT